MKLVQLFFCFNIPLSSQLFQFLYWNHILIYFLSVHSWDISAQWRCCIKLHCFIKYIKQQTLWMVSQKLPKGIFLLSAVNYTSRLNRVVKTGLKLLAEYVRTVPCNGLTDLWLYAIIKRNVSIFNILHRWSMFSLAFLRLSLVNPFKPGAQILLCTNSSIFCIY